MDNICLRLPNRDRVGLVLDVSHILAARNINIVSMEVTPNVMYLEIQPLPTAEKQLIMAALGNIPQVVDVEEIPLMPHQERAEQVKAVLHTVSDGIIAVDRHGTITHFNPAAAYITRLPQEKVLGQNLRDFFPAHIPLLQTLRSGESYDNREIVLPRTNSHYLTTGRPILDVHGRIIGAVAVLKDMNDVRRMVYSVSGDNTCTFDKILHVSPAMAAVVNMAKTIARSDSTVLIRGETGTGKELFARAIHAASNRAGKIFVPVNCAALPESLLDSELFGYEGGSFTGANKSGKQGLFEFAHGGTIFLDEIGEISPALQAKLLRVLEDGKVRRIGSNREISVDVRILTATNRNLEKMIQTGTFREDLYYRLNVIPLFIPPLRNRREDIPLLARHLVSGFCLRLKKPPCTISDAAMDKLLHHLWPGNVRELENVLERAVNIMEGPVLQPEHIILDQELGEAPRPPTFTPARGQSLADIVAAVEREVLTRAVQRHHSARQIGRTLGLSHTAVLKKLRRYGLTIPQSGSYNADNPEHFEEE